MTFALALALGTLGVVAMVFGLACFLLYSIGLALFERGLNEAGEVGGVRVKNAVWKIGNLFLGRERTQKLIGTDNPEANTRSFLRTRMRIGLMATLAGLIVVIASFFANA